MMKKENKKDAATLRVLSVLANDIEKIASRYYELCAQIKERDDRIQSLANTLQAVRLRMVATEDWIGSLDEQGRYTKYWIGWAEKHFASKPWYVRRWNALCDFVNEALNGV